MSRRISALTELLVKVASMAFLIVTGCDSAAPPTPAGLGVSETAARQIVESEVNRQSDGRLALVNFKKTDGQASEESGIKRYRMQYEADVKANEDCVVFKNPRFSDDFMTLSPPNRSGFPAVASLQKEQVMHVTGWVRFEKTEKGWGFDTFEKPMMVPRSPAPTAEMQRMIEESQRIQQKEARQKDGG
jgi:hypothetical protein